MDLNLDDLITAGKNAPAPKRGRPKGSGKSDTSDLVRTVARAAPKPSPWRAVGLVLLVQETRCACGCTYTNPVRTLTRFEHKRDGALHETAKHVAGMNPDLPRYTRIVHTDVAVCQSCFSTAAIRPDEDSHHDWVEPLHDDRFEEARADEVREFVQDTRTVDGEE